MKCSTLYVSRLDRFSSLRLFYTQKAKSFAFAELTVLLMRWKYCCTALNTLLVVVSPCCTYQRSAWQDFDESSASTPHWTHSWSQPSSVWVDVRTVFIWIQQMFAFFADSLNFTRTFVVAISSHSHRRRQCRSSVRFTYYSQIKMEREWIWSGDCVRDNCFVVKGESRENMLTQVWKLGRSRNKRISYQY